MRAAGEHQRRPASGARAAALAQGAQPRGDGSVRLAPAAVTAGVVAPRWVDPGDELRLVNDPLRGCRLRRVGRDFGGGGGCRLGAERAQLQAVADGLGVGEPEPQRRAQSEMTSPESPENKQCCVPPGGGGGGAYGRTDMLNSWARARSLQLPNTTNLSELSMEIKLSWCGGAWTWTSAHPPN